MEGVDVTRYKAGDIVMLNNHRKARICQVYKYYACYYVEYLFCDYTCTVEDCDILGLTVDQVNTANTL